MYFHVQWLESNNFLLEQDEGPTRYHWLSMLALSSGGFAICFILCIIIVCIFRYVSISLCHIFIFILTRSIINNSNLFFNSKYYNIIFFLKMYMQYVFDLEIDGTWQLRLFFFQNTVNRFVFSDIPPCMCLNDNFIVFVL